MNKRLGAVLLAAVVSMAGASLAHAARAVVYKSSACGCCTEWMAHLRANWIGVEGRNVADVAAYKQQHGVPSELVSCHTAVIDGYVIEGHVPAGDINRLLGERPDVAGLAVPGMPSGSPGMSGPPQPFNVVAFDKAGRLEVFARH